MTDIYPNLASNTTDVPSPGTASVGTPPSQDPQVPQAPEAPVFVQPESLVQPAQASVVVPEGYTKIEASRPSTPNTTDITNLVQRIPHVIVSEVPRVRTYADDIKNALSRDSVSLSRIALEEQKRRDKLTALASVSPRNPKNVALVIASVVLLGIAGASLWYFKTQVNNTPVDSVVVLSPNGIVPFDNKVELEFVDATNRVAIADDISRVSTQTLTKDTTTSIAYKDASGNDITTSVFFLRIGARAPEQLVRALDNRYMLGVYSSAVNAPFIILKTDSYQTAYAGMLAWEPRLAVDMDGILYRRAVVVGNETNAPAGQYVDRVVANRDMRAYVDQSNRALFFYGFITNELIIMAPNEKTISSVIAHINKQGVTR